MSANASAPGAQQRRFAAYLDSLAQAAEHADRAEPLKSYCTGLHLPGERKSVEPMAARLAPDNVRQTHQSLHHLVADAPWSDEALLEQVRHSVLPAMKRSAFLSWGSRCRPQSKLSPALVIVYNTVILSACNKTSLRTIVHPSVW